MNLRKLGVSFQPGMKGSHFKMVRLFAILITTALIFLGIGASAFALTHGALDQAIAFFWPAIALAVILAFIAPGSKAPPDNNQTA